MNMKDTLKLTSWLEERREQLENEGSSISALSKQAADELAFKVTAGSMKKALEATEIKLKLRKVKSTETVAALLALAVELIENGTFTATFKEDILADLDVPAVVKEAFEA